MGSGGLGRTQTEAPASMDRKTGGFRGWADASFRRAMAMNLENIVALLETGEAEPHS